MCVVRRRWPGGSPTAGLSWRERGCGREAPAVGFEPTPSPVSTGALNQSELHRGVGGLRYSKERFVSHSHQGGYVRGRWQCGRVVVPAVGVEPTPPRLKARALPIELGRRTSPRSGGWIRTSVTTFRAWGPTVGRHRRDTGGRTRTFTHGFKDRWPTVSRLPWSSGGWSRTSMGRFNRALPYRLATPL